jgi:hypothetical protein
MVFRVFRERRGFSQNGPGGLKEQTQALAA